MPALEVPVIGIGAGSATDGQVLVFHDLVGLQEGHTPKFVRRYAAIQEEMIRAVTAFAADVRARAFPGPEHAYGIAPEELRELRLLLERQRSGPREQ
jgi:3-methyl-2-oxobutanoate hydroxymethyltransferase